MKVTYNDGPTITMIEKAAVTIANDSLVTFETDGTVKAATAGSVIGVYRGRLLIGKKEVNIRLLGKGGTTRMIQNAAITPGAAVTQDASAPTKVIAATAGAKIIGYKRSTGNGAQNDIIEVIDVAPLGGSAVTVAAATTSAATITALTISGSYTQAEVVALRAETAKIATDLAALRAGLVSYGIVA